MGKNEKIAYASTVYGEKEISAVLKCLDEGKWVNTRGALRGK